MNPFGSSGDEGRRPEAYGPFDMTRYNSGQFRGSGSGQYGGSGGGYGGQFGSGYGSGQYGGGQCGGYSVGQYGGYGGGRSYGGYGSSQYGLFGSSQYGPSESGQYGPSGSGQYGPPGSGQYGPSGSSQYGPSRSGQYGPSGSSQYGPSGSGQYGPSGSGAYGRGGYGGCYDADRVDRGSDFSQRTAYPSGGDRYYRDQYRGDSRRGSFPEVQFDRDGRDGFGGRRDFDRRDDRYSQDRFGSSRRPGDEFYPREALCRTEAESNRRFERRSQDRSPARTNFRNSVDPENRRIETTGAGPVVRIAAEERRPN